MKVNGLVGRYRTVLYVLWTRMIAFGRSSHGGQLPCRAMAEIQGILSSGVGDNLPLTVFVAMAGALVGSFGTWMGLASIERHKLQQNRRFDVYRQIFSYVLRELDFVAYHTRPIKFVGEVPPESTSIDETLEALIALVATSKINTLFIGHQQQVNAWYYYWSEWSDCASRARDVLIEDRPTFGAEQRNRREKFAGLHEKIIESSNALARAMRDELKSKPLSGDVLERKLNPYIDDN